MNFRVENLWMLFGLFALAVPILLHLLRRRRYDILDWGAMQFLPDSVSAHRKRWLDEIGDQWALVDGIQIDLL